MSQICIDNPKWAEAALSSAARFKANNNVVEYKALLADLLTQVTKNYLRNLLEQFEQSKMEQVSCKSNLSADSKQN